MTLKQSDLRVNRVDEAIQELRVKVQEKAEITKKPLDLLGSPLRRVEVSAVPEIPKDLIYRG
jgi:hypothetical protein